MRPSLQSSSSIQLMLLLLLLLDKGYASRYLQMDRCDA